MSTIAYEWSKATPPKPDVYMTRRNTSKVHSIRYWDGERWHDIGTARGRVATDRPFKWPKKARVSRPSWMRHYEGRIELRKITDQSVIQWGTPFKVYDEKELIACLVENKVLPADWKEQTQAVMRRRDQRLAAAKGGAA